MDFIAVINLVFVAMQCYLVQGNTIDHHKQRNPNVIRMTAEENNEVESQDESVPTIPPKASATFPNVGLGNPSCEGRDFNITVTGKRCSSKVCSVSFLLSGHK